MNILLLCGENEVRRHSWAFGPAFERYGARLTFVPEGTPQNVSLERLIEQCREQPDLILHPEYPSSPLPWGLTEVAIPTACFQVDTYAYTKRRIRWSMLFDRPILFHPHFDRVFRGAGHHGALTLYHAVSRELFEGPDEDRVFEIGWVGRTDGPFYRKRRQILSILAGCFRMNDWRRRHTAEQMATVYRRSRVVVNVGRDDYPKDANLRVFEAMGAGAMLVTVLPTELTAIGFEEGVHFVGYRGTRQLLAIVRQYLDNEPARRRIAEAGREKVLREHTYDVSVKQLLAVFKRDRGQLFAPARQWSEGRVRLAYLDYYAGQMLLGCASDELRQIARRSLRNALTGVSLIARARARQLQGRVLSTLLRSPGNSAGEEDPSANDSQLPV